MILPAQQPAFTTSGLDIIVEWEEVACLLCGSSECSPLIEAPDTIRGGTGLWFAVVQCQKCGLCYTNPRPSLSTIQHFYPCVYRPYRTPENNGSLKRQGRTQIKKPRWGKEGKALPPQGRGRLLDFGCGGGSFLERMHQSGWDVTGIDVSPDAVKRIRFGLGLPAYVGSLPCLDLPSESFDLITMWQTLEHVHEPLEVLRDAYRLLAPGGQILVTVPNIDSMPFRIFGHAWVGLDLPRHLTHFTPSTLQAILERAGFTTGPAEMIRHSGWVRASARLARRLQPQLLSHRLLCAKPCSRALTWYAYLTGQADCILLKAFK